MVDSLQTDVVALVSGVRWGVDNRLDHVSRSKSCPFVRVVTSKAIVWELDQVPRSMPGSFLPSWVLHSFLVPYPIYYIG